MALSGLGKMGRAVLEEARQSQDFEVVAAVDQADPQIIGVNYFSPANLERAIASSDMVIDFSSPAFAVQAVEEASRQKKNFLVGTTGLSEGQIALAKEIAGGTFNSLTDWIKSQ